MKYLHIMPPSQRMMKGYLIMLRKYFNWEEHTILFSSPASGSDKGMLLFENTIDFPQLGKGKSIFLLINYFHRQNILCFINLFLTFLY